MTVRFAGFIETAFRIQYSVLSLIILSSLMFGHIWLAPTTAPQEKPRYRYFSLVHSEFSTEILRLPRALILADESTIDKCPTCVLFTGVCERRFERYLTRLWGSWRLLGLQSMRGKLWLGREISSGLCGWFLHIQLCNRTWSDKGPFANQVPWKRNKLTKRRSVHAGEERWSSARQIGQELVRRSGHSLITF